VLSHPIPRQDKKEEPDSFPHPEAARIHRGAGRTTEDPLMSLTPRRSFTWVSTVGLWMGMFWIAFLGHGWNSQARGNPGAECTSLTAHQMDASDTDPSSESRLEELEFTRRGSPTDIGASRRNITAAGFRGRQLSQGYVVGAEPVCSDPLTDHSERASRNRGRGSPLSLPLHVLFCVWLI
jgi:hypothetical protein